MHTMKGSHAIDQLSLSRVRVFIRKKFNIDTEFTQIVNNIDRIVQVRFHLPTPEQSCFTRTEKSTENGDGFL